MKTKALEKILKAPNVIFYDDTHPHPVFGKHVYVDAQGDLYTGCTTISEAWDKSFFLGPWYAKEMAEELKARIGEVGMTFQENPNPQPSFEKIVDECKGAAKRKGEKAKQDGTAAHDWIEKFVARSITGTNTPAPELVKTYPESKEAKNAVEAFLNWTTSDMKWLASEEVVASHEYKTAGKLDALAVIDGITYLVDFKTSGQISSSYLLQCAGYDLMLREMGLQVMGYMIIRIPKDGKEAETLTITSQEDMKFYRETFLKQREAHKFYVYAESKLKENGRMKVDEIVREVKEITNEVNKVADVAEQALSKAIAKKKVTVKKKLISVKK